MYLLNSIIFLFFVSIWYYYFDILLFWRNKNDECSHNVVTVYTNSATEIYYGMYHSIYLVTVVLRQNNYF